MRLLNSLPTVALFAPLGLALAGCPIWESDDGTCYGECCYGDCYQPYCSTQSECSYGYVCGYDNYCHEGDCYEWGCPAGNVCDPYSSCVPDPSMGGGGGGGAGGEGGGPILPTKYCGNPNDCDSTEFCAPDTTCKVGDCSFEGCIYGFYCDTSAGAPACKATDELTCGSDVECGGGGVLCVSGRCTQPQDLCFDQSQCVAGSVCANGKCTASCAGAALCEGSFTCTQGVNLCTTPIQTCIITNDCGGPNAVCVDGACVPRAIDGFCADADQVWVLNGCIDNQSAAETCISDGEQDICDSGSVCLHHTCYVSCETPNESACDLLTTDQCKAVTTPSGPHQVCGTQSTLGNQCDYTIDQPCDGEFAGLICIDGYCE